jgi:leucine dehydrogenase
LGVFESIGTETHEEVLFGLDHESGLRTIVAIHNTSLGPALGGTRFYPYQSEEQALIDVLRLSKGMTLKSAAAGLDLGGGKAVIIGDPKTLGSERLFRAYGRVVDSLGGRYITAEDVGTTPEDISFIARETNFVVGLPSHEGGSGDPSPATARGVVAAMHAVAGRLWASEDLTGKKVAVQGVGKVGMDLVRRLTERGVETVITDVDERAMTEAVETYGSKAVAIDEIHDVVCDIFAPCALGSCLSESTIARLRCEAVVGSANNQLAIDDDADRLVELGILYAPDFVVNAGGVINIAVEMDGYSVDRAKVMIDRIHDNLNAVLDSAEADNINPHIAALRVAERRIAEVATLRLKRRPGQHRGVLNRGVLN